MPDHLKPLHVRSVCEQCDPSVSTTTYSITPGYVHDRDFAKNHRPEANSFGLVFGDWSNGCQLLPSVPIIGTETSELSSALANPTSAAIVDVAARTANAITSTRYATATNYKAKVASAWYLADSKTCVKSGMSSDACQSTPSEFADLMGAAFETSLFHGQSISRVKVQQGLALLDVATDPGMASELKKDIVAHMLLPYYQVCSHMRMLMCAHAVVLFMLVLIFMLCRVSSRWHTTWICPSTMLRPSTVLWPRPMAPCTGR